MNNDAVILTCEHAGNIVPKEFSALFRGNEKILDSHLGWDSGALKVANYLSTRLKAPLYYKTISRLLIELNRSLDNDQLFSEFTSNLGHEGKSKLLEIYHDYRNEVIDKINQHLKMHGRAFHFSIHTFVPVLHGSERKTDIGILFDPAREAETSFSTNLHRELQRLLPEFTVMFNYPYLGTDDGFTTYLRKKFGKNYIGIELEINQKHVGKFSIEKIQHGIGEGVANVTNYMTGDSGWKPDN